MRVGSLAGGSVAIVRERETLRRDTTPARGRRVFLVVDPGLAALGAAVARRLRERGRDRRARHLGRRPRRARRAGQRVRRRRVRRARRPGPSPARAARTSPTRRSAPRPASASRTASPSRCASVLPRVDEPVGPDLPAAPRDAHGRGRVRAVLPRRARRGASTAHVERARARATRWPPGSGRASRNRSTVAHRRATQAVAALRPSVITR